MRPAGVLGSARPREQGTATVHYAALITGQVDKRHSRITGTVHVMQRSADTSADVDETCDTGTVKYVAIN